MVTEMKNAFVWLISRLDTAKERIDKFKDRSMKKAEGHKEIGRASCRERV